MDALEKAIRSAFEKGDAEDRAYREKVYRSAFAALDRALQANQGITLEKAIARRRDLQARIAIIESEFLPAVRAAAAVETRRAESGAASDAEAEMPPVPDVGSSAGLAPVEAPATDVAGGMPSPDGTAPDQGMTGLDANAPPVEFDLGAPNIEPAPGAPAVEPAPAAPAVEPAPAAAGAGAAPRVDPPLARSPPAPAHVEAPVSGPEEEPAAGNGLLPEIDLGRERLSPPAGPVPAAAVSPDRDERRTRRGRSRFGSLLLTATVLSALAIGGWWAYRTGLLGLPSADGPVPNPPQIVEDEDFTPGGEIVPPPVTGTSPPRNWIDVFLPSDAAGVNAPAGAAAEVMEDDTGTFLRVRSGGASVIFDVGQGVLEQIAGRTAVFDFVARGAEGEATQMSIECDFGELGDCGRKRYEVGFEKSEYLFEIDMPDGQPGASGSIAVNSDFEGRENAVDIYEIRVSVAE